MVSLVVQHEYSPWKLSDTQNFQNWMQINYMNIRLSLRIANYTKHIFTSRRRFTTSITSLDPYYILGVDKTADYEDIKKKYYKLAAEYHPDINKEAVPAFRVS